MLRDVITTPEGAQSQLTEAQMSVHMPPRPTPEWVKCSGCGLTKAADEFYVVRGPLWHGDWLAQPCADCCRWRVVAHVMGGAPGELGCDERPQP